MKSIRLEDVLEVIDADIVIMKIDIEGYECKVDITHITSNQKYVWIIVKALQPEILMNKRGKFIPFIFIEWGTLYTRQEAVCPEYNDWVQLFVKGGYQPANAGMLYAVFNSSIHIRLSTCLMTVLSTCVVPIAGNIWEKTDVKIVERDHWQDLVWIHASVQL